MQINETEELTAANLSVREMDEFIRSDAFSFALRTYLAFRSERVANSRSGSVSKVINMTEFSAYPFTDADGHYIDYRCPACGTKAKVRTLKRVRGKREEPKENQAKIPGTEV